MQDTFASLGPNIPQKPFKEEFILAHGSGDSGYHMWKAQGQCQLVTLASRM